jgi:endonuclease/exonuclease/phosphatase family metal-dependent hydrolase
MIATRQHAATAALLLGILLAGSIGSASAASGFRVMTFNVMCSLCGHRDEIGSLSERIAEIADTINRHDPDLVSLQELLTGGQAAELRRLLRGDYQMIYADGPLLGFPDPCLLVRTSRFRVLRTGGFWLGPRSPGFTLGWVLALPRRVEWAELEERASGLRFTFAGAHFDARRKNSNPSAELVVKTLLPADAPLIFAGDSNLRPGTRGFGTLVAAFRDTFQEVPEHPYVANGPTVNSDGCDLDPASVFPECRIDHVLLSPGAPWRTRSWRVDVFKYARGFASDHRAVVVDLE